MRDPRLDDLKRRIYAAAGRHGFSETEFAVAVLFYGRAIAWEAAMVRVRINIDQFVEGMRLAVESLRSFRERAEASGAVFSRYEPGEHS